MNSKSNRVTLMKSPNCFLALHSMHPLWLVLKKSEEGMMVPRAVQGPPSPPQNTPTAPTQNKQ